MRKASVMALGGVTAALAVVIMCLGGIIPLATYMIPVLCCVLLQLILPSIASYGWVWYAAVALLGLLLCPDKEAAAVFVFVGYYPILKPKFDSLPLSLLWKALFFNAVILAMYQLLIHLFGMAQVASEFAELGIVMTLITLALGNLCFFLLDRLLAIIRTGKLRRKR